MIWKLSAVAASALLACASSPSMAPHAMSAAEHDAAARRSDASAATGRATIPAPGGSAGAPPSVRLAGSDRLA